MNFQPRRREDPEVNITSLIDVVLMLLIFFMVATTFDRESELKVQLPKASLEPVTEPSDALELIISADGRYFINHQEVVNRRLETLKRALRQATSGHTDRPFVIRAAAQTPHQAVVTAMDAAGQLGITQLSIATVQMTEKPVGP